jgi:hypothetical protein
MRDRRDRLPNANSPQMLLRLLEMVGRGVRSTRGLQEALGVEGRTVNYYTQAAQWLGLMDEPDLLSVLGLELLYGGGDAKGVYARAVWANPLAGTLLGLTGGELPTSEQIAKAAAATEPELASTTLLRRASAVRSLIAPAAGTRPRGVGESERQLSLPMAVRSTSAEPASLPVSPGEYDPDVYRYVLGALLDHGELSLSHLRALLDRAGAGNAPIGGYVDLALSRGDAHRRDRALVVTTEAVARRDVASTTTSIILSDPGYREYLAHARHAGSDRRAEIRRDRVAARYLDWDERLFGHPLRAESVDRDLERVLLDRTLESFPRADALRGELFGVPEPFLDVWDQSGLLISLPPTLALLQGGLASVNRMLREAARTPDVGLPDLAQRTAIAHGGILHPGEPQPRSVPDARSLRMRTLMHAPWPALVAALLLLHRVRPERVEVVLCHQKWEVRYKGERLGSPLLLLDRFAWSRGWTPCRRTTGGLPFRTLIRTLESLEIAVVVGRRAVLAERFFLHLRSAPEEMELHARMVPLIEVLEAFLEDGG